MHGVKKYNLKADAIPTLFPHFKKPPKRPSSERGKLESARKVCVNEAFGEYTDVIAKGIEDVSKSTQVCSSEIPSLLLHRQTQTRIPYRSIGTQCGTSPLDCLEIGCQTDGDVDVDSTEILNSTFIGNPQDSPDETNNSTFYDSFADCIYDGENQMEVEDVEDQSNKENTYNHASFIVFWSCLQMLFKRCLHC